MRTFFYLIALLFSSFSLADQGEYSTDRLDWEKILKEKTTINIENIYGDIHIKKSYDNTIFVHAVAQNHKDSKHKAQIISEENKDDINIKIVFPDGSMKNERADLALLVPDSVNLKIVMKAGNLNAKKINFPIKITSEAADIHMSTSHAFDIFSKTGKVDLKLLNKLAKQSSSIQTHTSNIVIEYGQSTPYFDIISGKKVVSNSPELLNSKKQNKRHTLFNNPKSPSQINIVSDVGRIILIKQ